MPIIDTLVCNTQPAYQILITSQSIYMRSKMLNSYGVTVGPELVRIVTYSGSKEGYYPVGDIVVTTDSTPMIRFLIKPSSSENSDALRVPDSYSRIWNDNGFGACRYVQIWRVNCSGGYVSLGNVEATLVLEKSATHHRAIATHVQLLY